MRTTFSSTGNGDALALLMGQKFDWEIAGTFAASLTIKKSLDKGANWVAVGSVITAPEKGSTICSDAIALFRWDCTTHTSGSAVADLSIHDESLNASKITPSKSNPNKTSTPGLNGFYSGGGTRFQDKSKNYDNPATLFDGATDGQVDSPATPTPIPYADNWFLSNKDLGGPNDPVAFPFACMPRTSEWAIGFQGLIDSGAPISAVLGPVSIGYTGGLSARNFNVLIGGVGTDFTVDIYYDAYHSVYIVPGGLTTTKNLKVHYANGAIRLYSGSSEVTFNSGDDLTIVGLTDLPDLTIANEAILCVFVDVQASAGAWVDGICFADTLADLAVPPTLPVVPEVIGAGVSNPGEITISTDEATAWVNTGTVAVPVYDQIATANGAVTLTNKSLEAAIVTKSLSVTPFATDAALGTAAAAPSSGTVTTTIERLGSFFRLNFNLAAARIPVTDGGGSGSYGTLKLFDFVQQAIQFSGVRQDYTSFIEGAALTSGAGDANFVIALGSHGADAPEDGALNTIVSTNTDIGQSVYITDSGGTGAGTGLTSTNNLTGINGTASAFSIYLNWSGTAATIDANSTIDVTGTISIVGVMLGDD